MSQDIWNTIDPTTTSGNQLADYLNDFKDAMVSGLSGTSRPTNIQEGGYWIDITNDGLGYWSYKMYNGTDDIEIFQINKNTGGLIIGSSENELTVIKSSDDAFGPKLKLEKQRETGTQTLTSDVLGDVEFLGNDSSDVDYVQAKITSTSTNDVTNVAQGAYLGFYVTETNGTALVEAVRINDKGQVSIGTSVADKDLQISGDSTSVGIKAVMIADNASSIDLVTTKTRVANSGQVLLNDGIAAQRFESTDNAGTTFETTNIEVTATEDHTSGARGSKVEINNIKTGESALSNAISIEDDVTVDRKLIVTGDLEVQGDSTVIETATLSVEDANITINKGGDQASADAQDSGFTVEMSDATDAQVGYDSTLASKFKVGEIGSESEIMDVDSVQNAENKAIIDPSRLDVKKDTEANLTTYAATATDGQLCFATDTLSAYVIYDNTLQSIGGGGQGGINYVTNPDAEKGLDGVSVTGTIPLSLETTTPLFGTQSFTVISTGGDYAGDIIVMDIDTIDEANKYNSMSGNLWVRNKVLSAGEMLLKIYDVTNAQYVSLTSGGEIGASLVGDFVHPFSFMATDSVEYKAHLVVNTTDNDAFTFAWDNIEVGPAKPAVIGAPVTEWESFTPTGSWTTNTTYTGKLRRVGDTLEIQYGVALSGAPSATALTVDMPSGYTVDTDKLSSSVNFAQNIGRGSALNSGVVVYNVTAVLNGTAVYLYSSTSSVDSPVTSTAPFTFSSSDALTVNIKVPITGFSSGVQMSETTMNREISASYETVVPGSYVNNIFQTLVFPTKLFEQGGNNYDSTTGVYTIPESGRYNVKSSVWFDAAYTGRTWMRIAVAGGSTYTGSVNYTSATYFTSSIDADIDFIKGQQFTVDIIQASGGDRPLLAASGYNRFSIKKTNVGSQTISASEKVFAYYNSSASQTFTSNTPNTILFGNKIEDTHSSFSNGVFTAPRNGYYTISSSVHLNSAAWVNGTYCYMDIYKNSVKFSRVYFLELQTASTIFLLAGGTLSVPLDTSDTIEIVLYHNSGVDKSSSPTATNNFVSILSN